MYSSSEFLVLSFSSILATDAHVLDCKFPVLKIAHESIRDPVLFDKAMQKIADYVAWNFEVLGHGIGPEVGFYKEPLHGFRSTLTGKPLMGGFTAACCGFKADLKARKEAHRLRRNYNTVWICDRCFATQGFCSHDIHVTTYPGCQPDPCFSNLA